MANYTSLDQAQSALDDVNSRASALKGRRDALFEQQSSSYDEYQKLNATLTGLYQVKRDSGFFSSEYSNADRQINDLLTEIANKKKIFDGIGTQIKNSNEESRQLQREQDSIQKTINQFTEPGGVVTDVDATNPDTTEDDTAAKYANAEIVGDTSNTGDYSNEGRSYSSNIGETNPGAMQLSPTPATVTVTSMSGKDRFNADMRVKIRVPASYLTSLTSGLGGYGANDGFPVAPLKNLGGIIFPYTPTISVEHKADYAQQQPMHSNFAINFYQRSSVSPITITGTFTVQNEKEAATFIATVHLLRALTKMRGGGNKTGDLDSGAPPPVCRLDAYGAFMLDNVPVAISNFKVDFPDNVDYFTLGKQSGSAKNLYDMSAVPVKSSITVTCIPMYSRNEMQSFSVTSWLNNKSIRKGGYL